MDTPDIVMVSDLRSRCKRLLEVYGEDYDAARVVHIGDSVTIIGDRDSIIVRVSPPGHVCAQIALEIDHKCCRFNRLLIEELVMPTLIKHMVLDDIANS